MSNSTTKSESKPEAATTGTSRIAFYVPEFIEECVDRGIPVSLAKDDRGFFFRVAGFYKHDTYDVWLKETIVAGEKQYQWVARSSRYLHDGTQEINSFSDLVSENYSAWRSYLQTWPEPNSRWKDPMIEFGLVESVVETKTVFRPR